MSGATSCDSDRKCDSRRDSCSEGVFSAEGRFIRFQALELLIGGYGEEGVVVLLVRYDGGRGGSTRAA